MSVAYQTQLCVTEPLLYKKNDLRKRKSSEWRWRGSNDCKS